jgi:hypothetical protein
LAAVLAVAAVVAGVGLAESDAASARHHHDASTRPPSGLTVYGKTLWNLEALLHDTFGSNETCLRRRDYNFVSATCGDLANYGYWKNMFVGARNSRFKLVRLRHQPGMGNTAPIRINGQYVYCGRFPVAFGPLAHQGSRTRRWLVVLHGWAMTPLTCLGQ